METPQIQFFATHHPEASSSSTRRAGTVEVPQIQLLGTMVNVLAIMPRHVPTVQIEEDTM